MSYRGLTACLAVQRVLAGLLLISVCGPGSTAQGGEAVTGAQVRQAVDQIVESGKVDHSVVRQIRQVPRGEQPALAARLADSPQAAMRRQALMILVDFPRDVAAEAIRKLLDDQAPGIRNQAALYLAQEGGESGARERLLKNARAEDPTVAAGAVSALGALGGEDVHALLVSLLKTAETPKPVRVAAIAAAGRARARQCAPALFQLLDEHELRGLYGRDPARICDLAAAALERIYGINHVEPPGAYFRAPLEPRERGIARWQEWYAQQQKQPDGSPRKTYIGALIEESLKQLGADPDGETRARIKQRLTATLKTTFCLGDLPGIDAAVGPSVRDQWRILRVEGEAAWYKHVNHWQELELAYRASFLPKAQELPAKADAQALAFIRFVHDQTRFPRIWLWSFCRDFAVVFPKSQLLPKVGELRAAIESEFRKQREQVVLHGHIAVPEPLAPRGRPSGGMVPTGYTALYLAVTAQPSSWPLHRQVVEAYRRMNLAQDTYPIFLQQSKLYPGNEWPYLGNAAYQLRVRQDAKRALEFADKALILNPGTAKAYAIRGMIRVVSAASPEQAHADLARAYDLNPTSLGDEPETLQAVIFLVERTLAAGEKGKATTMLKRLGGLRAFGSEQPIKQSAELGALIRRVGH